jgi:aryl-alcohol dehydrogenase-like predicted oxidoreductase
MEYRQLGNSGSRVSVLSLGTMTFGGGESSKVGAVDFDGARRQVDLCIQAGINLFDTANIYSHGASEEILGKALESRRKDVHVATKARMVMRDGPNEGGTSRYHIIRECEDSLRRLKTDYIDLYQMHEWDGETPLEETLDTLDTLVRSGKVRYIGCSNYSGWHLMKALGISERRRFHRFLSQQIHYSLKARDAENELVPISIDQGVGILVWSPLAGGFLSGKYRQGQPTGIALPLLASGKGGQSETQQSQTSRCSPPTSNIKAGAGPQPGLRPRWTRRHLPSALVILHQKVQLSPEGGKNELLNQKEDDIYEID